jgi:hypothetical protein
MAQRLKVLISAYACEPGKGSEPEVGWDKKGPEMNARYLATAGVHT